MATYFADTYAMVEYFKGNSGYTKYFEKHSIITSRLNLMELYYWTLKDEGEELAEKYFQSFLSDAVGFDDSTIKNAMKFRLANRGKSLSYVDSIGYQAALENNVKFLTGDRAFAGMPNVEHVK
ncbi:MAG: PIN domain-containing protein [Candidatus Diapherotrites archaeon]|uniref:PIN domain-containing protein n=1 Tax=Candidatus Iainarchaeum sp. TaxID=3101447 RepID=A0A8T3YNY4_9ARCH|nr:PIN domain-containing protein [Candidatus Diapherotrites archaeon]